MKRKMKEMKREARLRELALRDASFRIALADVLGALRHNIAALAVAVDRRDSQLECAEGRVDGLLLERRGRQEGERAR